MELVINALISNKILMAIAVLLATLLVYSILKRVVKLLVIAIIALALYAGFMYYTGEKPDPALQKYLDMGGKDLKELQHKKEKLSETINTVNKLNDKAEKISGGGRK